MVERTVYIGNITASITEETLSALFAHCGSVTQVRISGDPSFNARFGFVEFLDTSMAHTACMLNGLMLAERSLRVSMAKTSINKATGATMGAISPLPGVGLTQVSTKPNNDPDRVARTIHISGVDCQVTEHHLAQYFSVCGEVHAVRVSGDGLASPRFGWVEFGTLEAAYGALSLDGQTLGMQTLKISPSRSAIQNNGLLKPALPNQMPNLVAPHIAAAAAHTSTLSSTHHLPPPPPVPAATMQMPHSPNSQGGQVAATVHVGGVDRTLTDTDLYQFFQAQCGTVVKVQMAGNITQPTRFAFVEFESPQAAVVACGLTGSYVGGYAIQISPAKSPIQSGSALVIPPGSTPGGVPMPSSGTDALSKVQQAQQAIEARVNARLAEDNPTADGTAREECSAEDVLDGTTGALADNAEEGDYQAGSPPGSGGQKRANEHYADDDTTEDDSKRARQTY